MHRLHKIAGVCASAVLFAACGGAGHDLFPTTQTALAPLAAAPSVESVLYYFKGPYRADGEHPEAGLIGINGALYGTTTIGGSKKDCSSKGGCGTVFEVDTSGAERVLYGFKGTPDGASPRASLLSTKGVLYGTTENGGGNGLGIVFALNPSTGAERIVYSFKGQDSRDGAAPVAAVVAVKGVLYGTTSEGGSKGCGGSNTHGCGTVFEVTTAGRERVLHVFKGGGSDQNRDGGYPVSGLTVMDGMLYGTTLGGGRYGNSADCADGCGTVFEISPSGDRYRILYRFKGGRDGAEPNVTLVNVNGNLYGTTNAGGGAVCGASGGTCGTVFEVSTSGTERILHRFKSSPDGARPDSLIAVNGVLYGTTGAGGNGGCEGYGCGSVFKISLTGTGYSVLHVFYGDSSDGINPIGNLLHLNGTLYGTTESGRKKTCAYYFDFCGPGTVFELTP